MREIELLCLASSYKPGGRCVAGIDLATSEWIRPVSMRDSGTIEYSTYHLAQAGRAIRPLDQVRMVLNTPRPEPEQPENWEIGGEPWELMDTWTVAEARDVLRSLTSNHPMLFGSSGAGLAVSELPATGVAESLSIIAVDSPELYVNRRQSGSKQLRAVFSLGANRYDLPVSDMEPWADALRNADRRQILNGTWRFTVSLAGRWNGTCYKLVAAGFGPGS